jgi:hypothetical protein
LAHFTIWILGIKIDRLTDGKSKKEEETSVDSSIDQLAFRTQKQPAFSQKGTGMSGSRNKINQKGLVNAS